MDAATILNTLVKGEDLKAEETRAFLDQVIEGKMTDAQIGGILTALRMKGETSDEILGLLEAMRAHMLAVSAEGAMDIVGTGGDGVGTFNISTTAAFVIAGAGVKVAKHGNRAASSKCGSADVLEKLGVKVELTPEQAGEVFKKVGMVFLWAPGFHPAMKQVGKVRKELKIRTIFNILGPFANPAGTTRQLVGVPNVEIAKKMAEAAKKLGYQHLLIVSDFNGMDEISLSEKTHAFELQGTSLKKYTIDPEKYGFKKASKEEFLGGNPEESADIMRKILGEKERGSRRDIVVLNAGFGLYVAGLAKTPKEGIAKAEESIDSGKAAAVLEAMVRETKKFAL